MSDETCCRRQDAQAVLQASPEANRGSLLEISRGARDFANPETKHHGLGDHLVVENEIVRVLEKGKSLQERAREGAETSVVLGQFYPQEQILKRRQQPVCDVFV